MNTAEIPGATWRKSSHSNGDGECVEVAAWRKSSQSDGSGNCVEVAAWRKSRQSNAEGNCVEVAALPEGPQVSIRDSKDPEGPALTVTPADWRRFMSRIKVSHQ